MYLLDETFHFGLQTPPSELDGDQFVRAHVRAVRLGLSLQRGWGGDRERQHGSVKHSKVQRQLLLLRRRIRYLPLGTQGPSARLDRLEQSGVLFRFVVLQKNKKKKDNERSTSCGQNLGLRAEEFVGIEMTGKHRRKSQEGNFDVETNFCYYYYYHLLF